jgi:hypothetical protein
LLLATLVVFCCASLPSDAPKSSGNPSDFLSNHAGENIAAGSKHRELPDAPIAKSESSTDADSVEAAEVESILPKGESLLNAPVKPAARGSYETARQRKMWFGLMAAGHGAAAFDAYSTLRAVSGGYGTEGDPLLRPFSHSNAMYAATQVSPAIMDYVGHKMLTSNHGWMRRIWWVPQVAGTSLSLSAAIHNTRLVP